MQDLEKKKCTWFIMETCTKLHTTYIRYIKYWNMALSKFLINFSNNWFKSNKCSYSSSAVWWVINRKMTHKKCTDHMQIKTYEIRILFSAWLTHKIKPLTDSRVRWNMNLQICFYPFFFFKKNPISEGFNFHEFDHRKHVDFLSCILMLHVDFLSCIYYGRSQT